MQAKSVREDQAEHLRNELEWNYHTFIRRSSRPWLTADARNELR